MAGGVQWLQAAKPCCGQQPLLTQTDRGKRSGTLLHCTYHQRQPCRTASTRICRAERGCETLAAMARAMLRGAAFVGLCGAVGYFATDALESALLFRTGSK